MPLKVNPKIALIGNPNSGKSSLFNQLTGLSQKIGNFPGVTVDKKIGSCRLNDHIVAELIDLPGTYSLYPRSVDERIVFEILSNPQDADYPDLALVVADASNLRRNLFLFTQILDLGIPTVLALNMVDTAAESGISIDAQALSKKFGVRVIPINARKGEGLEELKHALANPDIREHDKMYVIPAPEMELVQKVKEHFGFNNDYRAFQLIQQSDYGSRLSVEEKKLLGQWRLEHHFQGERLQREETIQRYQIISELLRNTTAQGKVSRKAGLTTRLDAIFTHKIWGYLIFFFVLFGIFQSVFAWASIPMDFIDSTVSSLSFWLAEMLPGGPLTDLLTEGIIPGIGGVLIFIPQIAILFGFIAVLEETGYMSRVVFLMDKLMRNFGLNGKSVVPLISGVACAIPAVMAARNIDNWKERMITIMVTPLMSCSARLPVYTILIALAVPNEYVLGFISLQGLALMGMYLLGFLAAIGSAYLMKVFLKTKERSYFIMELPLYRSPRWKNVGLTILEKSRTFVFEAGKIILAISIILWVLASYGPGDKIDHAEQYLRQELGDATLTDQEFQDKLAAFKLENSYAGYFGKAIEPGIKPLGFDWKIGIALITSFAAREVFVGTMATIYSVGSGAEDNQTVKNRMQSEINPETGEPMFTVALAFSLMVFYAFAMQCMSTVAVVYRETKSWKWPVIQATYMTGLAYLSSWLVYNLMK